MTPTIIILLFIVSLFAFLFFAISRYKREFECELGEHNARFFELDRQRKKDLASIFAKIDINDEKNTESMRDLDGRISGLQIKASEMELKVSKMDEVLNSIEGIKPSAAKKQRSKEFVNECVNYVLYEQPNMRAAASDLDVPYSTLKRWVAKVRK